MAAVDGCLLRARGLAWSERVFGRNSDAAMRDFVRAESHTECGVLELWREGALAFRADSPREIAAWDASALSADLCRRLEQLGGMLSPARVADRQIRWTADACALQLTPALPAIDAQTPAPHFFRLFSDARCEVAARRRGETVVPAVHGAFRLFAHYAGALAEWKLAAAERDVGSAPSTLDPLAVAVAHARAGLLLWNVERRSRSARAIYIDPLSGGANLHPAAMSAPAQRDLTRALDLAVVTSWEAATLPDWPAWKTYPDAFTQALTRLSG